MSSTECREAERPGARLRRGRIPAPVLGLRTVQGYAKMTIFYPKNTGFLLKKEKKPENAPHYTRDKLMTEKKLYLILQSVLCILLAVLLAASAVSIYREGSVLKEENPLEWIYTREKTAEKLRLIAPLFLISLGMTAAGWIPAVKDEDADKPVKDTSPARKLTVQRAESPDRHMKKAQSEHRKAKRALQLAVVIAALVFLVLDVMNGGAKALHSKAANICTECVGFG